MKTDINDLLLLLNLDSLSESGKRALSRAITLLIQKNEELEQDLQEANDSIIWWTNRFKAVERDNKKLKEQFESMEYKI